MAVVEISKIQVRRGQENQTGVPVLDSGEFGWASDTENLYIGLRRIDGGARDANVRILTENDLRNFFSSNNTSYSSLNTATTYTFRDDTGIATTTTNWSLVPDQASSVLVEFARTIQNKLDDIVNVRDFGAVGDGVNDDSGPIQAAITNLFLSDRWSSDLALSTGTEKTLYFPKGDYLISQKIYMPGKTKILGEGKDNTIIIQISSGTSFFATVGNDAQTNPGTGDYFPTNTAASPDYVGIEKMTLIHKNNFAVGGAFIQINCSSHSYVRDVRMVGLYASTSTVSTSSYAGIEIRSLRGIDKSQNISIENCEFERLFTGIRSNHDVDHMNINNNYFIDLDRGVVFCDNPASTDPTGLGSSLRQTEFGPRYAKITNNFFDRVFKQGIYVGAGVVNSSTYHTSMNNIFARVGNLNSHEMAVYTGTSIIKYVTANNISRNDVFQRNDFHLNTVDTNTWTFVQLMEGNSAIDSDVVKTKGIGNGSSATVILLPLAEYPQYATLKYHMYNFSSGVDFVDRRGTMEVYIPSLSNIINVASINFTDNYNYTNNDASSYSDWVKQLDKANRFYQIKLWNKLPSGTGATFNVVNNNTLSTGTYSSVTLVGGGSNYQIGDVLTIDGIYFNTATSTATSANSISITVTSLSGSAIASGGFTFTGIAATITNTTTFFISTTTNSRAGGAGTTLYLDYQINTMTV